MEYLKQSTSAVIKFGPFLDYDDGVTLEDGAAIITALDHASTGIMISKNGGALAVRHADVTATTYDAHGFYNVTLDATDTNTLGRLRVVHTDPATYLAVWQDYMIMPENVYDSMFGADTLNVDATVSSASVAAISAAVWNALTSAMTLAGTIGKKLADYFSADSGTAPALDDTALGICNDALMLLGNTSITSLSGTDKPAKLCTQFYQRTVEAVLRAYTWNAAMARSASLTAGTAPSFGYDYAYPLPSDCLRVISMQDDSYKFKIEGGYLLTDESECYVLYIKRIESADFDSLLSDAVAARLAASLAFPLTNSASMAEQMWKLYNMKLDEAQTVDAFEGSAPQMASDDWVKSRL